MWQKLTDVEEDQRTDSEEMMLVCVVHDGSHLAIFIPLNIHPTIYRKRCQFIVLLILRDMSRTIGGLQEKKIKLTEQILILKK